MLSKIISGGQTGVDRAALDAALVAGISIGGWCPLGRKAEDGIIASRYLLDETATADYDERTDLNVRDSDGTLILYRNTLTGGSLRTFHLARDKHHRPVMQVNLDEPSSAETVLKWISLNKVQVLNVAGPRESKAPGIGKQAHIYLDALIKHVGI